MVNVAVTSIIHSLKPLIADAETCSSILVDSPGATEVNLSRSERSAGGNAHSGITSCVSLSTNAQRGRSAREIRAVRQSERSNCSSPSGRRPCRYCQRCTFHYHGIWRSPKGPAAGPQTPPHWSSTGNMLKPVSGNGACVVLAILAELAKCLWN